jgi:hypothetical protein
MVRRLVDQQSKNLHWHFGAIENDCNDCRGRLFELCLSSFQDYGGWPAGPGNTPNSLSPNHFGLGTVL